MKQAPSLVVTPTHEVLPPKRTVPGPGAAIDPRVPDGRGFMKHFQHMLPLTWGYPQEGVLTRNLFPVYPFFEIYLFPAWPVFFFQ
jgi:hypothetical protein